MAPVRLTSQPQPPELPIQPAPFERAIRWCSEHEACAEPGWPFVFLTQEAYEAINEHAAVDMSREVGGMLVGQVLRTPEGAVYSIVEAQLPARHIQHGPTHLTFTSDTLTDLMSRREDEHPERQVVGWFHTHPGLSVFLSSYDTWLHTNFFPQPWQVALVIDPRADRAGFFRYPQGARDQLHPQQYVGFYELADGGPSIVTWQNFERAGDLLGA